MQKEQKSKLSEAATGGITERLSLGMVWGAISGAMIGAGISMTIGLFYSSATTLIFSVIVVSSILGAIFGQIMAGLLEDDVVMKGYIPVVYTANPEIRPITDLLEHKALKIELNNKIIPNQDIMAKINTMRSSGVTLPPYPDSQVFELIVSEAQKARVSLGQTVGGLKSLS
jgi:hypothetical protein